MPTDILRTDPELPAEIDEDAATRGAIYALLARAFETPDEAFYDALIGGELAEQVESFVEKTSLAIEPIELSTDDDEETLNARFNDLFAIAYSSAEDPSTGEPTMKPAISLYESSYRPNVSWNDVNLDIARAYDYFGVTVDGENREHHDHVRLELQFVGYLARREAAADGESAAAARRDFLDRHLLVVADGIREATAQESGTDVYGAFVDLLWAFAKADFADLETRLDGGTDGA